MEAHEAVVTVAYDGKQGELVDPVNFEATSQDVIQMVTEALHTGSVRGIPAYPSADLTDYVVDRFAANEEYPNRLTLRPKVPFGQLA